MDYFKPSNLLIFCNKLEKKVHKKYDFMYKKSIAFYDIICTFDTETTSTYIGKDKKKFAFVYEWSFCIAQHENYYTCYGRTLDEFVELMQTLQKYFNLNDSKKLIIWVHNLPFDFQFIRKLTRFDVFATDTRKPILAQTKYFCFRDSLILSAMSLEKTAKNLTSHKIEKLKGDLDYSIVRNSKTILTEKELQYCENDVLILAMYIQEQIDLYDTITKIPLTNTGRVREYVRNKCLYPSSKKARDRYRELMKELTLTKEQYYICANAFAGGFTHANHLYVGEILKNVHSIDFKSSYPFCVCAFRYPMSKPILTKIKDKKDFLSRIHAKDTVSIMILTFYDLEQIFFYESYLSSSKALKSVDVVENNGRVYSAKEFTIALTNIDYQIIEKTYKFSQVKINIFYSFYATYLPTPIIQSTLDFYQKKTTLKHVDGKETEYLVSKGMLNSIYGMMVTAIVRDEYIYNEEWSQEKADSDKQIEIYNKSKSRFLYYPWGIFVTAYARRNLWKGILSIGKDYIYSDTDSIKFLNLEKHQQFIDDYNFDCMAKLENMCVDKKISFDLVHPKSIDGKEHWLGTWDYEGMYNKFKTLGAKRYMIEKDGKIEITIAGLSKKEGANFIASHKKPFEYFCNTMTIPSNKTGKMTHTYIDDEQIATITDYQGNTELVKSPSSIHLEPCEFTLDMSKQFLDFLESVVKGDITIRF